MMGDDQNQESGKTKKEILNLNKTFEIWKTECDHPKKSWPNIDQKVWKWFIDNNRHSNLLLNLKSEIKKIIFFNRLSIVGAVTTFLPNKKIDHKRPFTTGAAVKYAYIYIVIYI